MNRQKRRISPPPQAAHLPISLGGYRVLGPLLPRTTFRAEAPGGGEVVLKILPSHCLLRGELHPSNHDRLSRVRELAEKGIANLHGIWRDRGFVYLVWDYLPGHSIASPRIAHQISPRDLLLLARELVLAVDSLHASGIVHGAIHANNVIIDSRRQLKLTHVSPLLYHDPMQDVNAVVQLLRELVESRGETKTPLGQLLLANAEKTPSLRQLAAQLAIIADPSEPQASPPPTRKRREPNPRRRALAGAALAAAVGIAVSFGLWQHANRADATAAPLPKHLVLDQTSDTADER